jgi:hypothetical protein
MFFAVATLLIIGACVLPTNLIPISTAPPTMDVIGLTQASIQANATQTAAAQPTVTAIVVTDSATGTSAAPTASALPSETATPETSPVPNLTTTPATATEFALDAMSMTATLAVPGSITVTPTPGVLTYGTLPPLVPFSQITLVNRSRVQTYISLQVTTVEGGPTILEYPVRGRIRVRAPIGYYLYVAWVGGNKMVGNFHLDENEDLTITLYRDRVDIK